MYRHVGKYRTIFASPPNVSFLPNCPLSKISKWNPDQSLIIDSNNYHDYDKFTNISNVPNALVDATGAVSPYSRENEDIPAINV